MKNKKKKYFFIMNRQKKLRKFRAEKMFAKENVYQEIFLDGYWYTKSYSPAKSYRPEKWIISEFTPESFARYKGIAYKEERKQDEFVKNLFNYY